MRCVLQQCKNAAQVLTIYIHTADLYNKFMYKFSTSVNHLNPLNWTDSLLLISDWKVSS